MFLLVCCGFFVWALVVCSWGRLDVAFLGGLGKVVNDVFIFSLALGGLGATIT